MKGISFVLAVSFLSFSAWSQEAAKQVQTVVAPTVYKSACVNVSDTKKDVEGRGVTKSWDRTLEISGGEAVVTKSHFSLPNCEGLIRRHLHLGLIFAGRSDNERYIDITSSFAVHEGPFVEQAITEIGFKEIQDLNAQVSRIAPILVAAGKTMAQPKYYFDPTKDIAADNKASGEVRKTVRTRVEISADGNEVGY